jgi:alpha-L-rhamnosidase
MGATTIWERWDGQKPDSTFQTPGMNSFNHYAYGAIGDWMYRVMAGLDTDPAAPGYKRIIIKPQLTEKITSAAADLETPFGKAASHWQRENGQLKMDVVIPANSSATVFIPSKTAADVMESGRSLSQSKDVRQRGVENGYVVVELGSGQYRFTVR